MTDSPALLPPDSPTRRQFRLLRRHLREGWRGAAHRRQRLTTLWREAETWLTATGQPHWLAYGTLLGWFREQNILAHDRDVDVALPLSAYPIICAAADQLPLGIRLRDTTHRHHGPKLYLEARGWELDLYFYREIGSDLHSTERSALPGETKPFPAAWVFPMRPVEFLGLPTWVPHESQHLLEHHYGYLGPDAVRDPHTGYFRPRS